MSDFVLDEMTIVPIKNTQSTGYTELSVGTIVEAMQTNNWGNAFVLVDLGDNKPGLYVRFFIIPGNTAYLGTKEYIDHGYWVGVQGSDGNNVYENTNRLIGWDGSKLWISQNQAYFDSKTVDGIAYECVGGNLADYGNQQAFYLPNTIEDIYIDNVLQPKYNVTISVDYTVPQNNYEYVKLVYKENRIPADITDGKSIDLDPTATTAEITGLKNELGTKYYFAIFTDKSVSDEFVYEVTEPIPRFSMAKKFKSDNGTFNYNIPSWIEDRVLQVLESDPSTTTIYFDVENYPEVANLYSHQFVEYPLQFRTYYGTYPETGSRPATSSYIAKDYKLEWLWTSGSAYRDETDYLKTNGEWVSVYTQGSGRSRADSNFESFVAEMFILDHIEKKGYPAYFSWAHSENWSGRKYQCQISKMGTGSRYADLATAIYNALK